MNRIIKITSYLLPGLNCLLLVLLVFESKLSIPLVMTPLGRMHPLLLHLPIGFMIFMLLLVFLEKSFEPVSYRKILSLCLSLTAVSLAVAALMGLFLSREPGYDADALFWHKWTGVSASFLAWMLFAGSDNVFRSTGRFRAAVVCTTLFIMVAGHFGAEITHGKNYLLGNYATKDQESAVPVREDDQVYASVIKPILESKCFSCHNDKKTKGGLNMSSVEKLMKGGKNGPLFVIGDALRSHMMERAALPADHKEHMPPKGKPQLTDHETALLTAWINEGGDFKKTFAQLSSGSRLKALGLPSGSSATAGPAYDFPAASAASVEKVNTPFCSVFPLAAGSPALQADFFVTSRFDRQSLEALSAVKDQLVILNLSKMPVTDEMLPVIAGFPRLERLILNQTGIKGNNLEVLKKCTRLRSLALANTTIGKSGAEKIADMPSLGEVFLWNTSVSETEAEELRKRFPKVNFDLGYIAPASEILQLNPPVLVNEEFILKNNTGIQFRHPLKEVQIRYTTDGSEPDSVKSPVYEKPVTVDRYLRIRAIATKAGWYASRKTDHSFFRSGFVPDTVYLLKKPDPKHSGKGGRTLADQKKGPSDNFNDAAWIAYHGTDMEALFEFREPKTLRGLSLSYLVKADSYIMPPVRVDVWTGNDKGALKLTDQINPEPLTRIESPGQAAVHLRLPDHQPVRYIRLVVRSVSRLPSWHPGKGEPGWFFTDEVFFY